MVHFPELFAEQDQFQVLAAQVLELLHFLLFQQQFRVLHFLILSTYQICFEQVLFLEELMEQKKEVQKDRQNSLTPALLVNLL